MSRLYKAGQFCVKTVAQKYPAYVSMELHMAYYIACVISRFNWLNYTVVFIDLSLHC
jgi:hypothetical protein